MTKAGYILRIFSDESGSPDPYIEHINNFGERYFAICSVLIKQSEYVRYKKKIADLRGIYEKYLLGLELKSHSIRRSNPKGVKLDDPPPYIFYKYPEGQETYEKFCFDFKSVVQNTDFKIISVATDKRTAREKYPRHSILLTLLGDLWERIAIFHAVNKVKSSSITFDPTGKLDDESVKEAYQLFVKGGSWFIAPEMLREINLRKRIYALASDSSYGIQLADYCVYPIKRFAENGATPFFNEVIKPKLCGKVFDATRKKIIYMGVKTSLNR